MRHLLILLLTSAGVLSFASPVLADLIETTAPVRAVTLYPWGAQITRTADFTAPAGRHEIIIPGLPEDTDPASLRIRAQGATLGAVALQQGRAQPAEMVTSPEVEQAKAELRNRERALIAFDAQVERIRAEGQAAADMVAFLVAGADGLATQTSGTTLESVNESLTQARLAMAAAVARVRETELDRDILTADLDLARQRLEALLEPDAGRHALVVAVETSDEPARIEITGFVRHADWQPVYDLFLDRSEGQLTLDRGLIVSQQTGEDWQDVALTLSTARPSDKSAPSPLHPWFPRVSDPDAMPMRAQAPAPRNAAEMAAFDGDMPVAKTMAVSAVARAMGATVVYDYPTPVTIRTGVDALRLRLDSQQLKPTIRAEAVPSRDSTAYLVAETVNTTGEVILPGEATLYADGAMVGQQQIELIPAGETIDLGFGPIDGLIGEYEVTQQREGDRGLISRSSSQSQTAVLRVRNLTGEAWPLRIIGQVPVSVQDDLRITWSADPAPSAQDPDGQRGLLYWDSMIATTQETEITLVTDMNWPEGKVLLDGRN